jgi:hypothetical protein
VSLLLLRLADSDESRDRRDAVLANLAAMLALPVAEKRSGDDAND